jgi:hypothetical protein
MSTAVFLPFARHLHQESLMVSLLFLRSFCGKSQLLADIFASFQVGALQRGRQPRPRSNVGVVSHAEELRAAWSAPQEPSAARKREPRQVFRNEYSAS